MRYLKRWQLAFVCLVALLLPPVAPARRTQAQTVTYTVTDLGTLGSAFSEANSIDDCGRVVGESPLFANGPPHPFIWSNGQITDIGTFGGDSGGAFGINASATVAGNAATTSNRAHIFIWTAASGKTDIGTLTGGTFATAFDINDSNQLVGVSDISTAGSLGDRGIFWQQSTGIQAIAPFPGGNSSTAYGINNAGQIVGTASGSAFAGTHAFLLNGGVGGTMIDLGTLSNGISNGKDSFATQINESGQVVGYSTLPSPSATVPFHAFLWSQATGMLDINPTGGGNSRAYDINDSGQVVGIFEILPFVNRAFIYTQADGMSDLNNSLAPGSNWTLQEARSINERGQIVGVGINPFGATHGFLLTPSNVAPSPCELPGSIQFSAATYSASEAAVKATITATRTGGIAAGASVTYATSDGTATAGQDYAGTSGTLNFAEGETSKTFDVSITNDAFFEQDETVNLALSNPQGGATLGAQSTAVLTITNDDAAPIPGALHFSSPAYNIGEGAATATITVSRSGGSDGAVSVSYATSDGTATANPNGDYAATSGTLNFADGDIEETFNVTITSDSVDESDETINLTLSNPTGGASLGAQSAATLTINDDDDPPAFSISDVALAEGNAGTTAFTFTVTKTGATALSASVNYSTSDGTAQDDTPTTEDNDYQAASGTLTFAPGDTSKQISVNVNGDSTFEPNETFTVNLSNASNATISDNQATGTIMNDDAAPVAGTLQFSSATYNIGEAAVPNKATITVTRTGGSDGSVSVSVSTSDGTATAGQDYTAITNQVVNFAGGETSKTFDVSITNDTLDEANETVNLTLSNPTGGASLGTQSTAVLTIDDDDDAPSFTINDVTLAEGNAGTTTFTFTVSKTGSTALTSSVGFATAPDTATASSDYQSNSGTLTFLANETSKQITVNVVGDTTPEGNETFFINLSGATNATISDDKAQGTISNDDASLSITDVTVAEGNSGTVNAVFNVTIPFATVNTITVNFATADGTANVASGDYASNSGTLTFNPGETSKPVNVTVNGDTLNEINETFFVNLSGATGATISDNQAKGTITDDDDAPSLSIGDATVTEGNGGTVNAAFVVTLSAASGQTVTASFSTADGTATTGDSDYQPITNPTPLTFAPGVMQQTINVQVNGDAKFENDETFTVNLTGATNASVSNDSHGLGTINNDDSQPSLTINDVPLAEGNTGTTAFTFTVTKTGETAFASSVIFATADGTAQDDNPASEDNDYQPTSGTLTFAANETSKQITVNVVGDTTDEPNETFFVNLSGATGATIEDAQGLGTITDDDGAPSLSISDVTVTEGDAGTTDAVFTVTLLPASGQIVSVNFETANISAIAGSDYISKSGALTFSPGETSKTIEVKVNGDTSNEADEQFSVNLSGAANATASDSQGIGTISNDDVPRLQFAQAVYDADESLHFKVINVTRTGDASIPVTVDYVSSDGTASQRNDYTFAFGTLRFAAGEISKSFELLLADDATTEASDETINLTLSNPTGGAVLGAQSTAIVTVAANDNPAPESNPIDDPGFFVRQHYHDFFGRKPDDSGLAFWTGGITSCGSNLQCREVKRIDTSAAFFLSIEFQETGYLVERIYKTSFGDAQGVSTLGEPSGRSHTLPVPIVRLNEFLPDTQRIGQGVVIGEPGANEQLEANKNAFALEFVLRQRFLTAFPLTMTPLDFVNKMNQNAGNVLTTTERDALVAQLLASANVAVGRASVLRQIAETNALRNNENNAAFVLMQFFGYLRRNPNDPQDTDYTGYEFWLQKLNQFGGDFRKAEMVKAFISSDEYRQRYRQ